MIFVYSGKSHSNGKPAKPFRHIQRLMIAFALLWICHLHSPGTANADFRVCNDTKSLVGVAMGYREKSEWKTEGWWQVPAETCASLIEGDLSSRFFYLYAEDADHGGQWRGEVFMCTNDREFRIDGIKDCFARGFQKTGFFEVDTGDKDSWMVRLTEAGQTGSEQ